MKYLQRFLSLLFALALSVGVFSTVVHAESYTFKGDLVIEEIDLTSNPMHALLGSLNVKNVPLPLTQDYFTELGTVPSGAVGALTDNYFSVTIAESNDQVFIRNGEKFTLTLNNLKVWAWDITKVKEYWSTYDTGYFKLLYTDGTTETINYQNLVTMEYCFDVQYSSGTNAQYITLNFTANGDVRKIIYEQYRTLTHPVYVGSQLGIDKGFDVSLEIESPEVGLLSGVLNKITDLWKTAEAGFANIVKGITELPQKLWEKIETGLKNLFVPDEEFLTNAKARFDNWAQETWGGIYQAVVLLDDIWDSLGSVNGQTTIEMPETTISLPDGNSFTFGGWVVKVIPDGFEFLANACRWAIAALATLAFINGLRKRWDRIFGG